MISSPKLLTICSCMVVFMTMVASTMALYSHEWTSSLTAETFKGTLTGEPVTDINCDSKAASEAGYYKIEGSSNQNYFYWFFESRSEQKDTDPVLIWLTGGPGCSSQLALLVENGPCSMKDGNLVENPYSWNSNANIMWIDQPTGVGYSYGDKSDYDSNEEEVGEDLYHFLQAFFEDHPQYQKNAFYVFGESYGGHYVPNVAHRVWQGNQNNEGLPINLKGLGIGNGLTDPEIQYGYYTQMATNNSYDIACVSDKDAKSMEAATPKCISEIQRCQSSERACKTAQTYCNIELTSPFQKSGLNVYDIRIPCEVPGLCYDFSAQESFFNDPQVMEALHVNTDVVSKWESCNMQVNQDFKLDWMVNYQNKLPDMLKDDIDVLIYAGDADFICNWYGNKAWSLALDWSGKDAFNAQEDKTFMVNNAAKGELRSANGFTFFRMYEAGHMTPMDQPEATLQMVNTFIHEKF